MAENEEAKVTEEQRLAAMAEVMHVGWLEVMAEQGYHHPLDCPRLYCSDECSDCRVGMVAWALVPEPVKEVNRRGARAMLAWLGFEGVPEPRVAEKAVEELREAVEDAKAVPGAEEVTLELSEDGEDVVGPWPVLMLAHLQGGVEKAIALLTGEGAEEAAPTPKERFGFPTPGLPHTRIWPEPLTGEGTKETDRG